MVDTQTMKIIALSVTDESVGDAAEFRPLLGQSMDAVGAKGGADDAPYHSKDPGWMPRPGAGLRPAPPSSITKPPRISYLAPRVALVGPPE